MARILFYSSVASKKQFVRQEYYLWDIRILRSLGHAVSLSKHWYDFLAFWRYDVAFLYFYRYSLIPAILARMFGKKVFFSGGIDYLDEKFASRKEYLVQALFYNFCGIFATRNIIVSRSDLRNVEKVRWLFPPSRQALSGHCFNEIALLRSGPPAKEKLVLTVAWMARVENVIRKGIVESLEFFKELHRRDPEYRMIIVGPKGEGSVLVESHIRRLELGQSVTLTGGISEAAKADLLNRAQIYLQLSRYEGFGIAAIEALAAQCVVVHSGAGGLGEGVGEFGLLWKPEQYSESVTHTLALIQDQPRYARWCEAGQEHVMKNFSTRSRTQAFQSILSEGKIPGVGSGAAANPGDRR
jgi:glycosyltransferase involved in cell wall biosynthesis